MSCHALAVERFAYLSTVPINLLFVLSVEWADSCDDLQEKN